MNITVNMFLIITTIIIIIVIFAIIPSVEYVKKVRLFQLDLTFDLRQP